MTSTATASAEITIDNRSVLFGDLTVEQHYEIVESLYGTKPDPAWELIDEAGHFHAYDSDGNLPTLIGRSRHIDCDGVHLGPIPEDECEGYDVTGWHCRICDQLVEPGTLPDRGPHQIPTMRSWSVEVRSERVIKGKVTVRVKAGDQVRFGVAEAVMVSMESAGGASVVVTTRLIGNGPLGRRP